MIKGVTKNAEMKWVITIDLRSEIVGDRWVKDRGSELHQR